MRKEIFEGLKDFASKDATRNALCGIHARRYESNGNAGVEFIATDGHILARVRVPDGLDELTHIPENGGVTITSEMVQDVIKLSKGKKTIAPNHAICLNVIEPKQEPGAGEAEPEREIEAKIDLEKTLKMREGEKKYPDIDKVIPKDPHFLFSIDGSLIQRISQLAKKLGDDMHRIDFYFNSSKKAITWRLRPECEFGIKADGVVMPLQDEKEKEFDLDELLEKVLH